jgi:hypothetical protein
MLAPFRMEWPRLKITAAPLLRHTASLPRRIWKICWVWCELGLPFTAVPPDADPGEDPGAEARYLLVGSRECPPTNANSDFTRVTYGGD